MPNKKAKKRKHDKKKRNLEIRKWKRQQKINKKRLRESSEDTSKKHTEGSHEKHSI